MRLLILVVTTLLYLQMTQAGLLPEDRFSYPNGNLGASGIGDRSWTDGDSPSVAIRVTNFAGAGKGPFAP